MRVCNLPDSQSHQNNINMMLNLYALLGVSEIATAANIAEAIDTAEKQGEFSSKVLQSARFYLLQVDKRTEYNRALSRAKQKGTVTTDWQAALAESERKQAMPTTVAPRQNTVAVYQQPVGFGAAPTANLPMPEETTHKMGKRHWLALLLCVLITGVLVAVLWQMAQVQLHQNEQITALQKMTAERRLPEDWPTWEQLDGETFLSAKEQANTKLTIYKNATQDLPVMLLPSSKRIDCGERGNQSCAVTLAFDGSNPRTFEAQIVGSSLVFNDMKQLPVLMHELSGASSIAASFPKAKDMTTLTFERPNPAGSASEPKNSVKNKTQKG